MMTKRDFITFAGLINDSFSIHGRDDYATNYFMDTMIEIFDNDNPNFSDSRFIEAATYGYDDDE